MEKVINDGKVAVLISAEFGGGWFTLNKVEECLYHPTIVKLVLANKHKEITSELCKELFGNDFYAGGARSLTVEWVPVGTQFYIEEYDGIETIITTEDLIHTA